MEIPQTAERGGHVRVSAPITSSVTYAVDLSAFVGRYVKISVDQRAYIGWRAVSEATDFVIGSDIAASLSAIVPDPIAAGDQGNQRFVMAGNPVLIVRARSTSITELIVKVTSQKADI